MCVCECQCVCVYECECVCVRVCVCVCVYTLHVVTNIIKLFVIANTSHLLRITPNVSDPQLTYGQARPSVYVFLHWVICLPIVQEKRRDISAMTY